MKPIVLLLCLASAAAAGEREERNDALVRQGFNLTRGIHFGANRKVREEVVFPDAGERTISLWMGLAAGDGSMRFVGPDGGVRAAVTGRSGEATVTGDFPAGKYAVEVEAAGGGDALLGIRGGVVSACDMDAAHVTEVPADAGRGFLWPYLLYVPDGARSRHLLVAPNNTGFVTDDVELLRMAATCSVRRDSALAGRLGAALLVPLFPRPPAGDENLYLHALTRASLVTKTAALARVDLQLLAMVRDARGRLKARGLDAPGGLLMIGFSASGSFVNRFALLHPGEVSAVASGSPGGWPLAPVAEVDGEKLPYPVGIADLPGLTGRGFDLAAAKRVRWLFLLGDKDENDAVPYRDSFSKTDQELVFRRFGKTPVERWSKAERLYAGRGLSARFVLYPGVGHQLSPAMLADIEAFFKQVK